MSLLPLAVVGLSTGLYGRAYVSVGDPKGRVLPAHRLGAGDEVRLHSTKGSKGGKGTGAEEGASEVSEVSGERHSPAYCWWLLLFLVGPCCSLHKHATEKGSTHRSQSAITGYSEP